MEIINYIYKTWSKQLAFGVMAMTMVLGTLAVIPAVDAAKKDNKNTNNKQCLKEANDNFASVVNNGGSVTGTFKIPEKCKRERIMLVVYKINDGNWENKINNQYKFDAKGHEFGTGKHQITVRTPNCAWQADLVMGHPAKVHLGEKQNAIFAAKVGGNGVPCVQAPAPAPAPTPTPGTPDPEVVVVSSTSSKQKVSDEVDALPETGPGAVVATFVGVSSLSGLIYRGFLRRFGIDQ